MQLRDRCALVTGAASGLGLATAQALLAGGASVIVADVSKERLDALQLGERAQTCVVDVRFSDDVQRAVALAETRFGALHIAVNCAGVPSSAKVVSKGLAHELELWQRVIDINLTGTFNVLRLAAVSMAKNSLDGDTVERGIIINTASIAAFDGQRGQAAYAASKAGVAGMSLPVSRDLAEHAIRCMAIAPGLFETPLLEGVPPKGREALGRSLLFPARPGIPTEFALLVLQIIANPYLNGTCIRLDGGGRLPG